MEQQPLLPEVITDDQARDALGRLAQNPNSGRGRPPGALGDAYKICRRILAMETPHLLRLTVDAAKEGNWLAMKMLLDRGYPVPRSAPMEFDLGPLDTVADKQRAIENIARLVASGEIPSDEGASITATVRDAITAQTVVMNGGGGASAPIAEIDARAVVAERLAKLHADQRRRAAEQTPADAA